MKQKTPREEGRPAATRMLDSGWRSCRREVMAAGHCAAFPGISSSQRSLGSMPSSDQSISLLQKPYLLPAPLRPQLPFCCSEVQITPGIAPPCAPLQPPPLSPALPEASCKHELSCASWQTVHGCRSHHRQPYLLFIFPCHVHVKPKAWSSIALCRV